MEYTMNECEFIKKCPFFLGELAEKPVETEELKDKYCRNNNLNCARYMISQAAGEAKIPENLYPDEKTIAYQVIAENC